MDVLRPADRGITCSALSVARPPRRKEVLIDSYGRTVDYLRVSVTERCNFRCQYCMPEKPFSWVPKENILKFEELFEFIKVAIDEGVKNQLKKRFWLIEKGVFFGKPFFHILLPYPTILIFLLSSSFTNFSISPLSIFFSCSL